MKIIFYFLDTAKVREYFKRKGNYMSEEDELLYFYNRNRDMLSKSATLKAEKLIKTKT
jgi:hypothetical protein